MTSEEIKSIARGGLVLQSQALQLLELQIDDTFVQAATAIAKASKVVATGLGKSGFIARKMAATITSVHIPGVYLHPVDALHGDLGMLSETDVLVAFSKSGETPEVIHLVKLVQQLGITVISITCRTKTSLEALSAYTLVVPIVRELDPHNILPTASTTQSLVMADLLSVAAAQMNGDVIDRLQRSHPQGAIGAALMRCVEDVMYSGSDIPTLPASASIADAVQLLTDTSMGIICVLDGESTLQGILTDGDVRRLVGSSINVRDALLETVMTRNPIVVSPSDSLHSALQTMENRERQISVVPVVASNRCVGVVRVHDIIRAQL